MAAFDSDALDTDAFSDSAFDFDTVTYQPATTGRTVTVDGASRTVTVRGTSRTTIVSIMLMFAIMGMISG